MKSLQTMKGWVRLSLNGVFLCEGSNLVVTTGKNLTASIFGLPGQTRPSHFALGPDNLVPDESQTSLQGTEFGRVVFGSTNVDGNSVKYSATYTSVADISVGELGIFNAPVAGAMLARFTPAQFSMALNDDLDIDWTLFFGN